MQHNRVATSQLPITKVDLSIKALLECTEQRTNMKFYHTEIEVKVCELAQSVQSRANIEWDFYIQKIMQGLGSMFPFVGYKHETDGYQLYSCTDQIQIIKQFMKNNFPVTVNNECLYFNDLTDLEKSTFLETLLPVYRVNY